MSDDKAQTDAGKGRWVATILIGAFNAMLGFLIVAIILPLSAWALVNTVRHGEEIQSLTQRADAQEKINVQVLESLREFRVKLSSITENRFTSEDGRSIEGMVKSLEARILREVDQLRNDLRVFANKPQPVQVANPTDSKR